MASRYPPRERSPRPFAERRPSTTLSARSSDSNTRQLNEGAPSSSRDAPRAPKALADSPRTPGPSAAGTAAASRGRGGPRTDFRENRDPPLSASTESRDRSWRPSDRDRDFDRRERRPSPRGRSPTRDSRGDYFPREIEIPRTRRNSRDGPLSAGSTYSEPGRGGGGRGRGRNDWDYRGRGRGPYADERGDSFRPRSRSRGARRERDSSRDRDSREADRWDDRDRERDRRFDRRDDDRRPLRDERDREGDRFKRDSVPARGEVRHASGGPDPKHPIVADRSAREQLSTRRTSMISDPPAQRGELRRDSEKGELAAARNDASRERFAGRASSPPQAPPVPAFGSLSVRPPVPSNPGQAGAAKPAQVEGKPSVTSTVASGPAKVGTAAPAAPKAQQAAATPAVAKAEQAPATSAGQASENTSRLTSSTVPPRERDSLRTESSSTPSASQVVSPTEHPASSTTVSASTSERAPVTPSAPAVRAPPTGPAAASRPSPSQPSMFARPGQTAGNARDASPGIPIPTGPRSGGFHTSPRLGHLGMNVPTGPKADRGSRAFGAVPTAAPRPGMSPAGRGVGWNRPVPSQQAPVIRASPVVPSKRDNNGEERPRSAGGSSNVDHIKRESDDRADLLATKALVSPSGPPRDPKHARIGSKTDVTMIRNGGRNDKEGEPSVGDVPMRDADDDQADDQGDVGEDDEDGMAFDDEDWAENAAKYEREKLLLESKIIDLSAPHLSLRGPLEQLGVLANITLEHFTIAHAATPEVDSISRNRREESTRAGDRMTPRAEESEDVDMDYDDGPPDVESDREVTPDSASLPFLAKGPPTPVSDLERDSKSRHISTEMAVEDIVDNEAQDDAQTQTALIEKCEEFVRLWMPYADEMDKSLEEYKRAEQTDVEETTGLTVTRDTSMTPAAAPPSAAESSSRRAHRFNSEYELQLALKQSEETHREEREKQEREARMTKVDTEREAFCPDMLDEDERARRVFSNANGLRPPDMADVVFKIQPPADDFTPEEHTIMLQYFLGPNNSKQWGKIAEQLPGRTYKNVINHYYATKWTGEYKLTHAKKKGKMKSKAPRNTASQARGKSNTLIADLAQRPEGDGDDALPLNLTDSGRPRRAAAPTFGDKETDSDAAANANATAATGNKRSENTSAAAVPAAPGGTPTADKTAKRPKATSGKSSRKTKTQANANGTLGVSPQKTDKTKNQEVKAEDEKPTLLDDVALPPGIQPRSIADREVAPLPSTAEVSSAAAKARQPVPEAVESRPPTAASASTGQRSAKQQDSQSSSRTGVSSYWSVQEVTDVRRYLFYYGTNFSEIADRLSGSKTATMVRNHFTKLCLSKDGAEVKSAVENADNRRRRNEDMGSPPIPSATIKRRQEPAPGGSATKAGQPAKFESTEAAPTSRNLEAVPLQAQHPTGLQPSSGRHHARQKSSPSASHPVLARGQQSSPVAREALVTSDPRATQQAARGTRAGFFQGSRSESRYISQQLPQQPQQQQQHSMSQASQSQQKYHHSPQQSAVEPQGQPYQPRLARGQQPAGHQYRQLTASASDRPLEPSNGEPTSQAEHSRGMEPARHSEHHRYPEHIRAPEPIRQIDSARQMEADPHSRSSRTRQEEHPTEPLPHSHFSHPHAPVAQPGAPGYHRSVETSMAGESRQSMSHPVAPHRPQSSLRGLIDPTARPYSPSGTPLGHGVVSHGDVGRTSSPSHGPSRPPPVSKPPQEPRKSSSLMSLLNPEPTSPERPRSRPQHVEQPAQQHVPMPPSSSSSMSHYRRDVGEPAVSHAYHSRPYSQSTAAVPQYASRGADVGSREHGSQRESWLHGAGPQHSGLSHPPQPSHSPQPREHHQPPPPPPAPLFGSHRSTSYLNAPLDRRSAPSPPPQAPYAHSRTSSYTQGPSSQPPGAPIYHGRQTTHQPQQMGVPAPSHGHLHQQQPQGSQTPGTAGPVLPSNPYANRQAGPSDRQELQQPHGQSQHQPSHLQPYPGQARHSQMTPPHHRSGSSSHVQQQQQQQQQHQAPSSASSVNRPPPPTPAARVVLDSILLRERDPRQYEAERTFAEKHGREPAHLAQQQQQQQVHGHGHMHEGARGLSLEHQQQLEREQRERNEWRRRAG